jgi:hypothetical protein
MNVFGEVFESFLIGRVIEGIVRFYRGGRRSGRIKRKLNKRKRQFTQAFVDFHREI